MHDEGIHNRCSLRHERFRIVILNLPALVSSYIKDQWLEVRLPSSDEPKFVMDTSTRPQRHTIISHAVSKSILKICADIIPQYANPSSYHLRHIRGATITPIPLRADPKLHVLPCLLAIPPPRDSRDFLSSLIFILVHLHLSTPSIVPIVMFFGRDWVSGREGRA